MCYNVVCEKKRSFYLQNKFLNKGMVFVMLQQDKSIDHAVENLFTLLETYADEINYVFEFINFLKYFNRLRPENGVLPLTEVINVLRNEKKQIFRQIKIEARYDMFLEMATALEMDYEKAKQRLEKMLKS